MAKRSRKNKPAAGRVSRKAASTGAITQGLPAWLSRDWLWGLILLAAVFLVYTPMWRAGYIWDDDIHLTLNPCIIGPLGLKDIWTTSVVKFCPFVFTTFWFEHALWGLAPLPYHLVNVLLHGASAVLLWRVLRGLQIPGAWLGAALWALHPVQVASVAWVSELKNTESAFFFLLTILFFIRGLKTRETAGHREARWNYGLTLLFAFLAMASKSSTVILPVVLALCAWWVEGRWHWRHLATVGPILLMTVIASLLTIWNPDQAPVGDSHWFQKWPERVAVAGDAVWFYLGKLLWPDPLMMIYPRWKIDVRDWTSYLPLLAATVAMSVFWLKRGSWGRPWFFALSYFVVALLPVLGLIDMAFFRYAFVSDHFQYLASMGALALVGAGLARFADFVLPGKVWLQSIPGAGVLLLMGFLSWDRAQVYENGETLWADTLAKNPDCWVGENNLADVYLQDGRLDQALTLLQKALDLNPDYDLAYNNLGDVLSQQGRIVEAIAAYRKALEINPRYVQAQNDLGYALCLNGQVDEAIAHYRKALELDPVLVQVHNNLGYALFKKGQIDQAMDEYQKSLELDPDNAQAHYNFGYFLLQIKKTDDAMAQFQRALELDPSFTPAHDNLGSVYLQKGQWDEAVGQFQEALRQNPTDSHAQSGLAQAQAAQK